MHANMNLKCSYLVPLAQHRHPACPKLTNLPLGTSASPSHRYNRTKLYCIQESLDVWSLGVMVFELFTGEPAIQMLEGKDKV